jgi:predicted nucleotidyltransferase/HEPN domain-containing protein
MELDQLGHLPVKKQRELQHVVQLLFEEFDDALKTKISEKARRGRIVKVILFGSYARGNWVEDHKGRYISDYDLLVVVNYSNFGERFEAWERAGERLLQELTISQSITAPVNFIVHTYADFNSHLSRGLPFFVDIARDGITLYDTQGYPFTSPKLLSQQEARNEAKRHFDHWFPLARHAIKLSEQSRDNDVVRDAAFMLHQAAERLYHCVLLVLTLYSPKSHKLTFLRSQAERLAPPLIDVWPRDTKFSRRSFSRLDRAYVDARYSPAFEITDEELTWLTERVHHLRDAVADVCADKLAERACA